MRLPSWTADEAVALSFGKDPDCVDQEALQAFPKHHESPFCRDYFARLEFLKRAAEANVVPTTLSPATFADWCRKNEILIPPSMQTFEENADEVTALRIERDRLEKELEILRERGNEDQGGRPKRSMLLRIIIGMAIARFEHRTEKSSSAAGLIEKCLRDIQDSDQNANQAKITASDDVIREVLAEAATVLDLRWEKAIGWRGTRRL